MATNSNEGDDARVSGWECVYLLGVCVCVVSAEGVCGFCWIRVQVGGGMLAVCVCLLSISSVSVFSVL